MTKDILMNFDMWGHWDDFCIQRGKDGLRLAVASDAARLLEKIPRE